MREHVAVGHEIPPEEEALEGAAQALSLAAALLHRLPRTGWFSRLLLEWLHVRKQCNHPAQGFTSFTKAKNSSLSSELSFDVSA